MKTFDKENLLGKVFIGEVLDSADPEKEGRCKIKIFGLFNSEDPVVENGKPTGEVKRVDLPPEDLPWASPANGRFFAGGETKGFGDISIPKVGTIVKVIFPTGDMYSPEWSYIHNLNVQAVEEIQDSYEGSHILLYDNDVPEGGLKIFYTEAKGLNIFFKSSQIIINPDSSITIEHKGGESIVEMIGGTINIVSSNQVNVTAANNVTVETETCTIDAQSINLGAGAVESVIKGNTFQALFNAHTHIGNGGFPTSPPITQMGLAALSQVSKTL